MANLNTERIKSLNGYKTNMEMPDLKIGDIILFDNEKDNAQGHVVTDIFQPKHVKTIIVQHIPEYTTVRNESMFVYGKINFRKKY